MTVLGLHCCAGFSLAVASRAYSLAAVYGLLIAVAWLLLLTGSRAHRPQQLWLLGSGAQVHQLHGFRCSEACGIFPIRDWTHVSCIGRWILYTEPPVKPGNGIFSIKLPWEARWASLVAWSVKNLPAIQEDPGLIPGWEDPLEKEMATHSSILAWRIPWTEEAGRLTVHGVSRVGHDWATKAPPPSSQTIPQKTVLWHPVLPRPCQIRSLPIPLPSSSLSLPYSQQAPIASIETHKRQCHNSAQNPPELPVHSGSKSVSLQVGQCAHDHPSPWALSPPHLLYSHHCGPSVLLGNAEPTHVLSSLLGHSSPRYSHGFPHTSLKFCPAVNCSILWPPVQTVTTVTTPRACMLSRFSRVRLFVTLWTVAHQAPLSMGVCRQEYRMGCHFLLHGIFPTQGSNPHLLGLLH